MKKILSIDVGGTKISHCVFNEKGEALSEIKKHSSPKKIEEMIDLFKKIISEHEKSVDYIAFATAGAINLQNTKVESSTPNLPNGYNKIDFSLLSEKPVFVENDANAAAWAEYKLGAAVGHQNTVIVTLGTGIGGGIIINGELLRGKSGRAAEIGSIKLFPDKRRKCTCNNYDCWESYASGTGLKTTAKELAESLIEFKESIYKNKQPNEITTHDIVSGIKENDSYSIKVFDCWHNHLLSGLISLTNIFDPESIVISGGMGEFIRFSELESEINGSIVVSPIKLLLAKMKNDAGMVGAALLAYEKNK